jgi:hypothetical protein
MEKPKPRRWFRFSLRTMFLLMTVVCSVVGWVTYQLNWIRQRHDLLREGMVIQNGLWWRSFEVDLEPPPWNLRLFGESTPAAGFYLSYPKGHPEDRRVRRLFPEMGVENIR